MEIQFTLPPGTPSKPLPTDLRVSSSKPAVSVVRGTTHRFALESRTRHTRRSSTRARTGCATCKKRHVKCDETRPACMNCIKWRGYCNSYTGQNDTKPSAPVSTTQRARLKTTRKPLALVNEPVFNLIRFESSEQKAYFEIWAEFSISFLSGCLDRMRLWTTTMPQLSLEETILRYGATAVGALRKACDEACSPGGLDENNKHYVNALVYYCKALRLQATAKPTREGLRTALLSSLLFVCFEALRGKTPEALKHIDGGFHMLNELAACTDLAPDLVSIAPAPPAMVEEILECYRPLEMQARSFMGSYRQFFFPPDSPLSASRNAPTQPDMVYQELPDAPVSKHLGYLEAGEGLHFFPSKSPTSFSQTGLLSPQSQGSPAGSESGQSSGYPPLQHSGLRILPFTKHTPYFRPKLSQITSLDEMPPTFKDMDEAAGYWSLVQRSLVRHIPMLTRITSSLALTRVQTEEELEVKLASVRQNSEVARFISDARDLLQRWAQAYQPFFKAACRLSANLSETYLRAINLRVEYLILYIYTTIPRFSGIVIAKGLTPRYREVNRLAEVLMTRRKSCGFAMDTGWTWPLFVSAFGCRDPIVRADAIRILGQNPMRNALRDSRVLRAIALRNEEAETSAACEKDDRVRWLRLRRREVVFEDFGANVIYRSAGKDPVTGSWGLVEEVASLTVGADGRLDWHRVPVSDSASILSGVC